MLSAGLDEIITNSLVGKPMIDRFMVPFDESKAVKVLNSASEECTMLRENMSGSILNCLKYNYDNGQKNFWAYEIGTTYNKIGEADEKQTGIAEKRVLAGVLTGEVGNSKWQLDAPVDFFTVKGIMENVFEELGVSKRIKLTPCEDVEYYHPYRSAKVNILGKNLTCVGYFGQIHPTLKNKLKIKGQDVFMFEINLDALIDIVKEHTPRYKKLPQFPEVRRDIAFVINDDVTFDDLLKAAEEAELAESEESSEAKEKEKKEKTNKTGRKKNKKK